MNAYLKETLCFGLDIGTRTVIGVVGYRDGEDFVLVDYECRAHEERAMINGQIHDIQKVTRIVYEIKIALEKRLGVVLKEVAVAAAGRSLSTQIVEVTEAFDEVREITLSDIHHLELEGVEKAKVKQQDKMQETDYYCVAYSVIQYYLDEYVMVNLEGHKGHQIKAKLIATFLPKQVIDSLYAVTERAELIVSHLTLEPIAAINAVIPKQIRLLNLALIDIGAGTSDIAITKEGSIVSYGMIPSAGDEVTEAIVHKYLVDFNTAEMMKKQAIINEKITFTDIIGMTHTITSNELSEMIAPVIETMTCQIAQRILSLNGGTSPNAVFCVGGGSQMLEVTSRLGSHLGIAKERVALRSTTHLVNFKDEIGMLDSPEMITPVGICMNMIQDKYNQFTCVEVNDQKVQLLNAKKLTILDAIIAVGIEHSAMFPKKGSTLMFKLNGERQKIKGESGVPATILLNGKEASIQEHIKDGDVIGIEFATHGMAPHLTIGDLIKSEKQVKLEGQSYDLPLVLVNGNLVTKDYVILSNDEITISSINTLKDLLDNLGISMDNKLVTKDFKEVKPDYMIQDGDAFLIDFLVAPIEQITDNENRCIPEEITQEKIAMQQKSIEIEKESLYVTVNHQLVCLPKKDSDYIFAGVFDFIDFDLSRPQGTIQLIRNGRSGALTDILHDGDILEIYWKK